MLILAIIALQAFRCPRGICCNVIMKQLHWQYAVLIWWEYQPNIVPRLVRDITFDVGAMSL